MCTTGSIRAFLAAMAAVIPPILAPRKDSNVDAFVENLAHLLHQEVCGTPGCARGEEHWEYYQEKARSIISQLEPEIGHANVYLAVRVVLEELS